MKVNATCPNGHQWEAPASADVDSSATLAQENCPICGALPVTVNVGALELSGTSEQNQQPLARQESKPSVAPAERSIAGYDILSTLGHGGMGVVYKARQLDLNRIVALKMIRAGSEADPHQIARFKTEARAVAQLQHPNIVQIYDVDEWRPAEGSAATPYFSLEYVDGGSLATKLKAVLPTPRQAAQICETLARAVHFAHQRGIIHRDLKPGNILLASVAAGSSVERTHGATATEYGIPKITDFGLAKNLEPRGGESEPLTRSGDILGTPSYMAPEQAAGNTHAIGPATDIYALGTILYEMITGRAPFSGKTTMETLHRVLSDDPVPPGLILPRIPRDLQTICMTCLHKDPGRRYASAEALADDLCAFLAGEPIKARPVTAWERAWKWVMRTPAFAFILAAAWLVLAGLLIGALWYNTLAVSAIALVGLLLGAGWYSARLRNALREIRAMHQRAERNVERLHLLLEATNRLMRAKTQHELLQLLSETTTRMANAERATIYLVNGERNELKSHVLIGDGVDDGIRVPLGTGIAGTVAVTGEIINLPDPYADSRFNQEIDRKTGYVTRNLLTVPMIGAQGRVIGVFQVLNKRGGPFDDDDAEILGSLAASAAVAVENAV
ncbi:MAG: GAF domain-containing protein [Planctomycetes bacterium]|nr:GAF domain-containing protein [Planctomycetota bacterium]